MLVSDVGCNTRHVRHIVNGHCMRYVFGILFSDVARDIRRFGHNVFKRCMRGNILGILLMLVNLFPDVADNPNFVSRRPMP